MNGVTQTHRVEITDEYRDLRHVLIDNNVTADGVKCDICFIYTV